MADRLPRLLCAVVLLLAACSPAAPASPPPAAQREAPQPAEKQELIVGAWEDEFPQELNRPRLGMYPLNASMCEPLVKLGRDLQIEPGLATKWEYRGDNTYRFTLRQGVTFHDGRALNAEAVKYTLDQTVKARTQYSFLGPESARIVDGMTLDVRPTEPNLRLLDQLVHPTYAVIAPGTDPSARPVCTGPFKFAEYARSDHLTVVRNDAYWGNKAGLEKVTFRFIPDDNTRALALQAGEVDAIFNVNRGSVNALKGKSDLKIVTAPPGAVFVMYMTSRGKAPYTRMGDPTLRRAVALSIDRKAFVERVLDGYGEVVNTVNPPTVLGRYARQVEGVPYDPRKAAELLDGAGWKPGADKVRSKDGQRLSLSMSYLPTRVDSVMAEYVQAQLANVGIEAKIDRLDSAAYTNRLNNGEYDLNIEMPNQNDANPAFLLALRWYSKSATRSVPFVVAGAEYDALVEQALTATDHEQVQQKAAEAMHLLIDRDTVAIPLAGVYRVYAMKDRVQGFEPHPSGTNQWWDTVWAAVSRQ